MNANLPRQSSLFSVFLIGLAVLVLWGCSPKSESPAQDALSPPIPTDETPSLPSIQAPGSELDPRGVVPWFEGDVEAALSLATQEHKPLLLFWGVAWCPACDALKNTVFVAPEFIALSSQFIPVYLDGDSHDAQRWGEQFAVRGYPSVIVMGPQGDEITRFPTGIDVDRLVSVLASVITHRRSSATLYSQALANPAQLTPEDYNQLAFYSWWQQSGIAPEPMTSSAFSRLAKGAAMIGNAAASDRLLLLSLLRRYSEEQSLSIAQVEQVVARLKPLLADRQAVLAHRDILMYWSEELLSLVAEPGPARSDLVTRWVAAMKSIRYLDSLSSAEQMATWLPELYFYWMDNPEASRLLLTDQAELLAQFDHLNQISLGPARHSFVSQAAEVLLAARLPVQARNVLTRELTGSAVPYYAMAQLAAFEQTAGNASAALLWRKKAYQAARGPATRFQWGVDYLIALLQMQPDNLVEVERVLEGLLANLAPAQDVFAGRNFKRLRSLLAHLEQWSGGSVSVSLAAFYASLQDACLAAKQTPMLLQNCLSLGQDAPSQEALKTAQ